MLLQYSYCIIISGTQYMLTKQTECLYNLKSWTKPKKMGRLRNVFPRVTLDVPFMKWDFSYLIM